MKSIIKDKNCIYIIIFIITALVFLQRCAINGSYEPVMDDWFLYGDVYENKLTEFIIPNEKFAIRPMAGLVDIFIVSPLFKHLWIVQILITVLMIAGAFFLLDTFRQNDFPAGGLFILTLCMLPMNMEATYWIAASIRISCALFFTGLSCWLLNEFLILERKPFIIAYCIIGFAAVSFYEPAIAIYLLLSCYLIISNKKKHFGIFAITAIHIIYIALYYICNGFSTEIGARGHLLTSEFLTHTADVTDMMARVFVLYNWRAFILGLEGGTALIIEKKLFIQAAAVLVFSVLLGFMSCHFEKENRKYRLKRFVVCLILFIGGIALFYLLDNLYIAIRFVYFSFIGIGLAVEELMLLVPYGARKIMNIVIVSVLSCVFTVSGMGIVMQYQQTSETDVRIVKQILELDTENFATNPDRNTYLLGAEPYYKNIESVRWLESIRGACSSYADLTGCLRHVSGMNDTNNLTPAANGSRIKMSYYIDNPDICRFFALDDDLNVINVYIYQNGNYFEVRDDEMRLYGVIEPTENGEYIFWKKSV